MGKIDQLNHRYIVRSNVRGTHRLMFEEDPEEMKLNDWKRQKPERQHVWLQVKYMKLFMVSYQRPTFFNDKSHLGFLPWEMRVAFPGESQLRKGRAI